ncbi:hypothetical protein HK096_009635 [Nowakowskiella sp. JEL0078]|nr:hypothetical protein HK096_009635 [Nowakowskiella sp. JEL0078]
MAFLLSPTRLLANALFGRAFSASPLALFERKKFLVRKSKSLSSPPPASTPSLQKAELPPHSLILASTSNSPSVQSLRWYSDPRLLLAAVVHFISSRNLRLASDLLVRHTGAANDVVFSAAFAALAKIGDWHTAKDWYEMMVFRKKAPTSKGYASLLMCLASRKTSKNTPLVRADALQYAKKLHKLINQPAIQCENAFLMVCLSVLNDGGWETAKDRYFSILDSNDLSPDIATYSIMFKICAEKGSTEGFDLFKRVWEDFSSHCNLFVKSDPTEPTVEENQNSKSKHQINKKKKTLRNTDLKVDQALVANALLCINRCCTPTPIEEALLYGRKIVESFITLPKSYTISNQFESLQHFEKFDCSVPLLTTALRFTVQDNNPDLGIALYNNFLQNNKIENLDNIALDICAEVLIRARKYRQAWSLLSPLEYRSLEPSNTKRNLKNQAILRHQLKETIPIDSAKLPNPPAFLARIVMAALNDPAQQKYNSGEWQVYALHVGIATFYHNQSLKQRLGAARLMVKANLYMELLEIVEHEKVVSNVLTWLRKATMLDLRQLASFWRTLSTLDKDTQLRIEKLEKPVYMSNAQINSFLALKLLQVVSEAVDHIIARDFAANEVVNDVTVGVTDEFVEKLEDLRDSSEIKKVGLISETPKQAPKIDIAAIHKIVNDTLTHWKEMSIELKDPTQVEVMMKEAERVVKTIKQKKILKDQRTQELMNAAQNVKNTEKSSETENSLDNGDKQDQNLVVETKTETNQEQQQSRRLEPGKVTRSKVPGITVTGTRRNSFNVKVNENRHNVPSVESLYNTKKVFENKDDPKFRAKYSPKMRGAVEVGWKNALRSED